MQKTKGIREAVQKRVTSLHLSERFRSTHRSVELHVGDGVWVRKLPHEFLEKLHPLWTGPCEVLRRIDNTARYVVNHHSGEQDVHTDRLKLYLPALDGERLPLHYYRPHRAVPHDDAYEVEATVAHCVRRGLRQWRVRWKGYDESFDTWEPASSFVGHPQEARMRYNTDHHINVVLRDLQDE